MKNSLLPSLRHDGKLVRLVRVEQKIQEKDIQWISMAFNNENMEGNRGE
jgi:hypothetical protein